MFTFASIFLVSSCFPKGPCLQKAEKERGALTDLLNIWPANMRQFAIGIAFHKNVSLKDSLPGQIFYFCQCLKKLEFELSKHPPSIKKGGGVELSKHPPFL